MKITLRKANAVQAAINEAITALDLDTNVSVNEFEKPNEKIAAARIVFTENSETREVMLAALYDIRRNVARANAAVGINDILTEVALLEKQIGHMTRLSKSKPCVAAEVMRGKLGKIRSRESGSADTYRFASANEDEVATSIFEVAEIDEFRKKAAEMKKRKLLLQDTLLELNVKTQIEVDADSVPALTAAGIL